MLANSWSIALLVSMAATLFLVGAASYTGISILLHWDAGSDSEQQIALEGQTWLAAALVENGLALQILSLVLLVIAAGEFSQMIAGAMCATGTFLANEYGSKSLYFKIAGIFLYGFWIVLHRLDLRSESYPLIRIKFSYLLVLLPILLADCYFLYKFLSSLEPDIITSCCGVIFSERGLRTNFLLLSISSETLVAIFYSCAAMLFIGGLYILKASGVTETLKTLISLFYGVAFIFFFVLSLVAITVFFSSYIYAMPHHRCPFDILHKEYSYIGFPIYFSLFSAAFLSVTSCFSTVFSRRPGLSEAVFAYRRFSITATLWLLVIFVMFVTFPTLVYFFAGGEI